MAEKYTLRIQSLTLPGGDVHAGRVVSDTEDERLGETACGIKCPLGQDYDYDLAPLANPVECTECQREVVEAEEHGPFYMKPPHRGAIWDGYSVEKLKAVRRDYESPKAKEFFTHDSARQSIIADINAAIRRKRATDG
jgi:hypothetical protein